MSSMLLSGPTVEPVTIAEAKAYLRVEHDDDDDVIAALIAGARVHVEAQTRRALITQSWRLIRDAWPEGGRVAVLPAPLRALTAARIYRLDGTTEDLDPGDFIVEAASAPAVLSYISGAPPAPGRIAGGIELDIEAGYGDAPADVPGDLRQAIRSLVADWYENRGLIATGQPVAVLPGAVAAMLGALPGAVVVSGSVVDPGVLNRRLVLEAPVESADGSGGVTRSFTAVATLWASVAPISARGSVEAGALGASVTHRIRLRYNADITLRHRFRDGDAVFRIVAIRERDKRFLDIDAEQRAD